MKAVKGIVLLTAASDSAAWALERATADEVIGGRRRTMGGDERIEAFFLSLIPGAIELCCNHGVRLTGLEEVGSLPFRRGLRAAFSPIPTPKYLRSRCRASR
jgi:hypothetical protein